MKLVFCFLILISTAAFAQKAKPVKQVKPDSAVLNAFHLEQLRAFDQQGKDIQTAAAVLDNDRRIFLNAIIGRQIVEERDSVVFNQETSTVKVFRRNKPLPPPNRPTN